MSREAFLLPDALAGADRPSWLDLKPGGRFSMGGEAFCAPDVPLSLATRAVLSRLTRSIPGSIHAKTQP